MYDIKINLNLEFYYFMSPKLCINTPLPLFYHNSRRGIKYVYNRHEEVIEEIEIEIPMGLKVGSKLRFEKNRTSFK